VREGEKKGEQNEEAKKRKRVGGTKRYIKADKDIYIVMTAPSSAVLLLHKGGGGLLSK